VTLDSKKEWTADSSWTFLNTLSIIVAWTPVNLHLDMISNSRCNHWLACNDDHIVIITRIPILKTRYVEQHLFYCFPLAMLILTMYEYVRGSLPTHLEGKTWLYLLMMGNEAHHWLTGWHWLDTADAIYKSNICLREWGCLVVLPRPKKLHSRIKLAWLMVSTCK